MPGLGLPPYWSASPLTCPCPLTDASTPPGRAPAASVSQQQLAQARREYERQLRQLAELRQTVAQRDVTLAESGRQLAERASQLAEARRQLEVKAAQVIGLKSAVSACERWMQGK